MKRDGLTRPAYAKLDCPDDDGAKYPVGLVTLTLLTINTLDATDAQVGLLATLAMAAGPLALHTPEPYNKTYGTH